MSNIEKMKTAGNHNHYVFARTVEDFANSQGIYSRIFNTINNYNENEYNALFELVGKQNFKDPLDVMFWIES